MEPEDFRRELDGLRAEVRRKPSKGWVIGCSIITTLLVLVILVALMMFGMMNRMQGVMNWSDIMSDRQVERPFPQTPSPPPPAQPLPR